MARPRPSSPTARGHSHRARSPILSPLSLPGVPTGALAHWVADFDLADVPDLVRERAKHLLLDGIGCALIGAGLPWSRVATEGVLDLEG
jgi:MmgE/PrpD N-terminal domain